MVGIKNWRVNGVGGGESFSTLAGKRIRYRCLFSTLAGKRGAACLSSTLAVNVTADGAYPQRWRVNGSADCAHPQRWRVNVTAGRCSSSTLAGKRDR
ncbi:hypothetical protein M8494_34045 (plasmid) [Serratia ureilytica]